MVYYVRFLKTPRFQHQKKAVFISALICIATDLGDDFLAEDVDLVATWAQYPSQKVLYRGPLKWKAGARQVPVMLGPFAPHDAAQQMAILTIQSKNAQKDALGVDAIPLVMSGCSAPFGPQTEPAEKLILRELSVPNGVQPLRIWEETGNSIARHIWDAALASIIFLEQTINGTSTHPPALRRLLRTPRSSSLQAVELGAGCGIVGIALATMLDKCDVLLTDLPEVEEIVTRNIKEASPRPSSRIQFQTLDWDEPPPDLRSQPLDLILISDCTYNADSLPALVSVLGQLVRRSPEALVLVALKRRHDSEAVFFELMRTAGFTGSEPSNIQVPGQHDQVEQIELYCYRRQSSA